MLYEFGAFRVDTTDRQLWRDGQRVSLAPKSFELLVVMLEGRGKLIRKQVLIDKVWPGTFVEESNVAQHVATLRRVLGDTRDVQQFIQTVPKEGYRFVCPVVSWSSNAPGPNGLRTPSRWQVLFARLAYVFNRR